MEITATKKGLAPASYFVDTYYSNRQGDPNANRYNFGIDLKENWDQRTALVDAPLITHMSVTQTDAIYTHPSLAVTLTFSEPMNTLSVEKNIRMNIFEVPQNPDEQPLSCVPQILSAQPPLVTFQENDFTAMWSPDTNEVNLRLKTHLKLPSPDKVWIGQITFNAPIRDMTGISRPKAFFRLNHQEPQDSLWLIFE